MRKTSSWKPRSWIVPPGLVETLIRFEIRCDAIIEKNKQGKHLSLLIRGETGVGKSMFAEFFIHKYLNYRKGSDVIFINCSAIPETLLESELFGHKKGSSSSAFKDKLGLFEIVDDGVIVLEELGEISEELQAKLLIAIENRVFIVLGDTKQTELKAQIIATSNVEKKEFRADFWYRLETFTVPPIHARRCDVLYYISHFDPELIELLTGGIVLALFCYNWPGNVREIEMVCNSIRENIQYARKKKFVKEDTLDFVVEAFENEQFGAFFRHDPDVSTFQFDKTLELARKMVRKNINIDGIEELLNQHSLSLNCYNPKFKQKKVSKLYPTKEMHLSYIGKYITILANDHFGIAYMGFGFFCNILFQDTFSDKDILDLSSSVKHTDFDNMTQNEDKILAKKFNDKSISGTNSHLPEGINIMSFLTTIDSKPLSLMNSYHTLEEPIQEIVSECLKYLTGIPSITCNDIKNIKNFYVRNKDNKFLSEYFDEEVQGNSEEVSIVEISLDDLRILYYETVCNAIGVRHGFQKELAAIAKRTPGRITQELEKYGLKEKFSELNFQPRKRLVILK